MSHRHIFRDWKVGPASKNKLSWYTENPAELASATMLGTVTSIRGWGAAKLMQSTGAGALKKSQVVMVLVPPATAVMSTRPNGTTALKMVSNVAVLNKVCCTCIHTYKSAHSYALN